MLDPTKNPSRRFPWLHDNWFEKSLKRLGVTWTCHEPGGVEFRNSRGEELASTLKLRGSQQWYMQGWSGTRITLDVIVGDEDMTQIFHLVKDEHGARERHRANHILNETEPRIRELRLAEELAIAVRERKYRSAINIALLLIRDLAMYMPGVTGG